MLTSFFRVIIVLFVLSSCTDGDTILIKSKQEQLKFDILRIEGYLNENNLSGFTSLDNGLYYKVIEEGNSLFPVNGDTLKVNYVGQFLDGIEFDRNGTGQPFEFILGTGLVIEGWDIGLKYIDEEGTGILIVPSGLGYGNTVSGSIPPNSVLVFRVSLLDIKWWNILFI